MNNRFRWALITYSAMALAGQLVCPSAHAQESESSARELFKDARQLASDGKYTDACPRFEKSLALEAGMGTQFNLADCWEHIGRFASARELFLTVAEAAIEKGETDRARLATERAVALAPKLSRLQIKHDRVGVELRVTRAGVLIERDDWNRPSAVDPGHYSVELLLNGKKNWSTEVDVPARALTVLVTVPAKGNSGQTPSGSWVPAEAETIHDSAQTSTLHARRTEPLPPNEAKKGPSIWPTVAILAGIAGVGTGTVFALIYESKNAQAKKICPASIGCSDYDISQHGNVVSSAQTARVGAYLGFGLGAASIAAGTIYYATRPSKHESPPSVSFDIAPAVEPGRQGFWGAAARGTW